MPKLTVQTEHLRRELEHIVNKLIDSGKATSQRKAIQIIHKQLQSGKRKIAIGFNSKDANNLYQQYKDWKRSKARINPSKHTV